MKASARPAVRSLPPGSLVFLACAWCAPLFAQTPATPADADRAWDTLKNFGRPQATAPATPAPNLTRVEQAAKSIDQASQLKAFYTQYPNHVSAKEAKQREVVSLAFAALHGDATQDERRQTLLAEVRKDAAIPAVQRSESVAWSNRVELSRRPPVGRVAVLAAEETLTRGLLTEFPEVPAGYDSLLGIARDTAPERGQVIARDLLAMGAAPPAIKSGAQRLLDRYALLGKPLAPILQKAGAATLVPGGPAKVTVIYAWSSSVAQSLASAKRMAGQAPRAAFLGLCLDTNLPVARQAAADNTAPGEQYYDSRGAASPLAAALSLGRSPVVYLVDRDGIIRDVQGHGDFASKIAQLEK